MAPFGDQGNIFRGKGICERSTDPSLCTIFSRSGVMLKEAMANLAILPGYENNELGDKGRWFSKCVRALTDGTRGAALLLFVLVSWNDRYSFNCGLG